MLKFLEGLKGQLSHSLPRALRRAFGSSIC